MEPICPIVGCQMPEHDGPHSTGSSGVPGVAGKWSPPPRVPLPRRSLRKPRQYSTVLTPEKERDEEFRRAVAAGEKKWPEPTRKARRRSHWEQ